MTNVLLGISIVLQLLLCFLILENEPHNKEIEVKIPKIFKRKPKMSDYEKKLNEILEQIENYGDDL